MCSQSKAALFGAALLFLWAGSFRVESANSHPLSDYVQMACEVHVGAIELVITTLHTTPDESKITITAASSVSSSITSNSRLGLFLKDSIFPVELAITHGKNTLFYTLDHHCELKSKPD